MNKAAIVLALCGTAALAESNFSAPLLGIARDARQQLRFVHGVSGNFVLRQTIAFRLFATNLRRDARGDGLPVARNHRNAADTGFFQFG